MGCLPSHQYDHKTKKKSRLPSLRAFLTRPKKPNPTQPESYIFHPHIKHLSNNPPLPKYEISFEEERLWEWEREEERLRLGGGDDVRLRDVGLDMGLEVVEGRYVLEMEKERTREIERAERGILDFLKMKGRVGGEKAKGHDHADGGIEQGESEEVDINGVELEYWARYRDWVLRCEKEEEDVSLGSEIIIERACMEV